jgi:Ca2+-binding EF-hand superfamily protein
LNELGSALREATKLVKELASEFKHLTENFAKSGQLQSAVNVTTLADDLVHLVRMAIVADPESFLERAVADSKDGTISRGKFTEIFKKECNASEEAILESAKRLFDQLDTDKDDKIWREKFENLFAQECKSLKLSVGAATESTKRIFDHLDTSKDEKISREKFENLFAQECKSRKLRVGQVSESAKRLFDLLDTNKDEKISMPELTQITDVIRQYWKESECETVISAVLMGLVQDVQ